MENLSIDKQNGTVVNTEYCGIYCISNSKYFYIGLSNNIKQRWYTHRSRLRRGVHENYIMQQVYNKYNLEDPFKYEIVCHCEPEDLATLEVQTHREYCEKYPDKISMNIANCGSTCTWTDEMKRKASKSHTGIKFSAEHRKAISEGQKGCIRLKQRIPIVQLDLNGKLIKVWDSKKTASKELSIRINLNRKSSGGFQWQKYEEWKINPKGPVEYVNTTPVCQYSKNGDFIKKYNSIQEASDLTGIKRCNIGNALSGIQKTAGGFIWKH